MIGPRTALPLPAWKTAGSPAKISFACSGRANSTSWPAAREQPDGEGVAVPPVQPRHGLVPEAQQGHALQERRPAQPRRQPAGVDRRRRASAEGPGALEALVGPAGGLPVQVADAGHGIDPTSRSAGADPLDGDHLVVRQRVRSERPAGEQYVVPEGGADADGPAVRGRGEVDGGRALRRDGGRARGRRPSPSRRGAGTARSRPPGRPSAGRTGRAARRGGSRPPRTSAAAATADSGSRRPRYRPYGSTSALPAKRSPPMWETSQVSSGYAAARAAATGLPFSAQQASCLPWVHTQDERLLGRARARASGRRPGPRGRGRGGPRGRRGRRSAASCRRAPPTRRTRGTRCGARAGGSGG